MYGLMGGAPADGNGDGVVNAADYTVWRDAMTASAAAVPEPRAAMLCAMIGCAVLATASPRRKSWE